MSLVGALALPIGKAIASALLKRDANQLSAIPVELLDVFLSEVLTGAEAEAELAASTYRLLGLSMQQDFDRDYGAAVQAMKDANRASTEGDRNEALNEAFRLLRAATAGVKDPLRKSEVLLTDAVLGILRNRPDDAIDRAMRAWQQACTSFQTSYSRWRFPNLPIPGLLDQLIAPMRSGPPPKVLRARSAWAGLCIQAAGRAEEASALLAAAGIEGHPSAFRLPVSASDWNHTATPFFAVFGGASAASADGDSICLSRNRDGSLAVSVERNERGEPTRQIPEISAQLRPRAFSERSITLDVFPHGHAATWADMLSDQRATTPVVLSAPSDDDVVDVLVGRRGDQEWRIILDPKELDASLPA